MLLFLSLCTVTFQNLNPLNRRMHSICLFLVMLEQNGYRHKIKSLVLDPAFPNPKSVMLGFCMFMSTCA